MFLVSAQKRSNRLEICKNCEHYLPITKSCGTLGLGSEIEAKNGDKVKLCGCVMPIKSRLKIATCPLRKWHGEFSKKELNEMKALLTDLEGVKRITAPQNVKLTELWNKAAGRKKNTSSCNSCVKKMIQELQIMIQDE